VIFEKAAVACDGLLVKLEVLGIFLKKQCDIEIWIQTLNKLHEMSSTFKTNEDHLNSTFWIMYDNLLEEENDMFLDIPRFFCDDFFVENGLKITLVI